MNLLQRASHLTKLAARRAYTGAYFAITGQWEGYEINRYRNRPFRRLRSQDADLDLGTREGLMSEARSLAQTFGIVESILSKFANYCVGPCRAQWYTSDRQWNKLAEKNWETSCQLIDYTGTHDMQALARLAVMSYLRDGDIFSIKTVENGFPQLQAIEADRVTNAKNGQVNVDTDNIVGGVILNSRGIPIKYRVCERNRFGIYVNPEDVPRQKMLHLFSPTRVDAVRFVTAFKTALNHLRDIKETLAAWKTSVKAHSKISFIVKNLLGQPGPGVELFPESDNGGEGAGTAKVEEIGDGIIQYLMRGDDIQTLAAPFPPEQAVNLVMLLIRDISIGVGLPFEFVWNMAGLGGPATRMMSTQAQRTFEAHQNTLERRFLNPTCSWVTSVSMFETKRLPFHPEWYKFKITRPPHTTIDVGRESVANLAEHQRGLMSGRKIAEERGEDIIDDVHENREREASDLLERATRLSKASGRPFELCLSLICNSTPNGNPQGGATSETETEMEPSRNK